MDGKDDVAPDQNKSPPNFVILQNIKLKPQQDGVNKPYTREDRSLRHLIVGGNPITIEPSVSLHSHSSGQDNKDQPAGSTSSEIPMSSPPKKKKKYQPINIFAEYTGPEWHKVSTNIVTKPIISSNLPKIFKDFPIFSKPNNIADLKRYQEKACQEFVGLTDAEYEKEKEYCSPEFLLSGKEMEMASLRPTQGLLSAAMALREEEHGMVAIPENPKLRILQELNKRLKNDSGHCLTRKLKYRGVRLLGLKDQEEPPESDQLQPDLEPGKDILFRVRVYRPFEFSHSGARHSHVTNIRGRHSVFSLDLVVLGRQLLSEMRDRIVCRNDLDLRLDMSKNPDLPPPTNSKESFPSNFMFINNVFYVDTRQDCRDITAVLRRFAEQRGIGSFPVRDMCRVTVGELQVRFAHPEVYVHQGNCEHIFQFSEARLLGGADPLRRGAFPAHTAVSQNQTLYCSTCAEFSARWIVTKSQRVPFDPAFFCDSCFRSYMYVDGKKVDDFSAFLYKGNEMNVLRPNVDLEGELCEASSPQVREHVTIHF